MALEGRKYQRLQVALLSAFPTPQAMSELLRFRLNESLDQIVMGANYRDVVFRVIEWAVSRNRLPELVLGAREENPGNPELQLIAGELELAAPPTNDLGNLVPLLRWADANGQLGQLIALACGPGGATVDIRAFVSRTLAAATNRAPGGNTELLAAAEKVPATGGPGRDGVRRSSYTESLESMVGFESMAMFEPLLRGAPEEQVSAPPREESAAPREEIFRLADEYVALRGAMPSGERRTALQEDLATRMRMLAPGALGMLPELSKSASAGQRLAAVTILQEAPRADYLDWLVERQREGEVPFLGYHAAIALRNAARALAAQRELVRRAIAEAIAAVKARYPDRYQERNRYPVLAGALALVTGERRVTRG